MKKNLQQIYKKLYAHFGPQYWWPAQTPFEVMLGAILTQNTSWNNAEKAIDNLKKEKFLEPIKLYRLSHKRLAAFIRPAGYYNIKAKRLKEFLSFLNKSYQGNLKIMAQEDTQDLRQKLLSVKGIGQETADSILLYALQKPVFVVDAYTKRILLRHNFIKEDAPYEDVQNLFMENLNPVRNIAQINNNKIVSNGVKKDASHVRNTQSYRNKISNVVKLFNEYHALLVKLGKEFCLKNNPKCQICPLK